MLRFCRCGALAPRGGGCPNCGSGKGRRGSDAKRRLGGSVLQRIKRRVMREQNYRCAECDRPQVKMELDHITALGLGGSERRANLQALCHECHVTKTNEDRRAMRKASRPAVRG